MAEVMQWLAVAENELLFGLARARAVKRFGRPWDLAQCQAYGRDGLRVLEAHLGAREWLVGTGPTIADVACYPYVALAPEGEIPLDGYSSVSAWIGRVQALPGYVNMEGIERAAG
jgi:glutathione S-transferase